MVQGGLDAAPLSVLRCCCPCPAGGPGPRLESWALALDSVAMELVMEKEVLKV